MKKACIHIIMLFTSLSVFSQSTDNQDVLQVYPPNAYALARYGDIPVDYSTGVPDITIPLMSISDKDVTVNVSLSYHATGIKVDQEATWVGLGWVLNAGGVITRDIRGAADDGQQRPVIEDFVPDPSNYNESLEQYINTQIPKIQQISTGLPEFIDGESDIYYYNFNGRSGKFFLDNDNKVCLSKYDDIDIDKNTNTITDDSGVKYFFNKPGYVTRDKMYIVSWYLTKIVGPSGGEIYFEYDYLANYGAVERAYSVCFIDASINTGSLSVSPESHHAADLSYQSRIEEPLLSRITTKSGSYIDFTPSTEKRRDCAHSSGRELKKIALYNAQDEFKKGIGLDYGYFEANTVRRYRNRNNVEVTDLDYLNYRLRLESIKEVSESNEPAYAYHFEYYGDDDPATNDVYTLPYRLSPNQDHWGYYNESYNSTIFPGNSNNSYRYIETDPWFDMFANEFNYVGLSPQSHTIYGADREPNAEAAKAGTLNKITYPTGGYTQFDFEANGNAGSTRGGLRIKQIETSDNNGNISKKNYSYSGYVEDLLYVNVNRNYYHTYFYNPILYAPSSLCCLHNTHNYSVITSVLVNMGVPPELVFNPSYNYFKNGCGDGCGTYLRVVKINGTSPLRLGIEGETAYSKVTEEIEGLGKIEYNYANCGSQYEGYPSCGNYPALSDAFVTGSIQTLDSYWENKSYSSSSTNSFTFPYPSSIDFGWRGKLLTRKRVFDIEENLVAEDSIFYTTELLHAVPNFKAIKLTDYNYAYTRSYNIGGMAKIRKEVNRLYDANGNVARAVKEYGYASPHHKKVTESKEYTSQGDAIITKYYYPADYGNYFSALKERNIIAPVDVRAYRGNKLVSGKQIKYNDRGQPETLYSAEPAPTVSDIAFDTADPFTFSPNVWRSYGASHNLQTLKTRDGTQTSYFWSYGQTCPVVKAENIEGPDLTAKVNSAAAGAGLNTGTWISDPVAQKAIWENFNSTLRNLCGPGVPVTTYTYDPLRGMTSRTDPAGITTSYEYDGFGRLQIIKDEEGNALRHNEYKYVDQQ